MRLSNGKVLLARNLLDEYEALVMGNDEKG